MRNQRHKVVTACIAQKWDRERGYAGPMWDGVRRGGIAILRYETWDVYDMLSR